MHEDTAAVDYHMKQKQGFSNSHDAQAYQQYRQRFAAGTGSYPLVGTPEQIAAELARMHEAGFGGAALTFVNYVQELPYFCERVLPCCATPACASSEVRHERSRPARAPAAGISSEAFRAGMRHRPAPSPCWPPAAPMARPSAWRRLPSARSAPSRPRCWPASTETLRWAASSRPA